MSDAPQATYEFGEFRLDRAEKRLLRDGKVVALAPKAFDTLLLLVENHGRLVSKEELLKALWPDTVVEEVGLAHNVSHLRKVLRDAAEDPKFIETVPKRGYRFIAPLRLPDHAASAAIRPRTASGTRHRRFGLVAIVTAGVLVLVAATGAFLYWRTGVGAGEDAAVIRSVAVLPLKNLSGDQDQEYFADGITDALITDLAQLGSLRVISRTSVMQFKDSRETLPQIGHDLHVDAVVEGTVARGENRVRVTAQLIEARSDRHLWAKTYEHDLRDVLALQDEIARDIAERIQVRLTPRERSLLTQVRAADPEAHDAYLRGRYWWHKATTEAEWRSLDYFQRAVAKDPGYALGYAGIADSFIALGHHSQLPAPEAFSKATEAATKALEIDPALAEAHTSLGLLKFSNDWDWAGAEKEFKQALALNPNYATAHHWYAHYLTAMGRLEQAVKELEQARDIDPYSIFIHKFLAQALYYNRRYDDSLREYLRGMELFPTRWEFYDGIAEVYEQKKMFAEAYAIHQRSLPLTHDSQTAPALAEAYQHSGYRGWLLEKLQLVEHAPELELAPLYPAHLYAVLNDEAHTMAYLERAYGQRNPWLLFLQVDPALDFLHSSPGYHDLVRRLGLPPASSAAN